MIETGEFDFENRMVAPNTINTDSDEIDYSLRPKTLSEYIGQEKVKENLSIYIEAAKKRGEPLDHVLLYVLPDWAKPLFRQLLPTKWV